MEHIKKKMLAMKLDKENAVDEADQLEAKLREKELEMQTKDEEAAEVVKKIQQVDTDKETAQTQLAETNTKLEETDKRATEKIYNCSENISAVIRFPKFNPEVLVHNKPLKLCEQIWECSIMKSQVHEAMETARRRLRRKHLDASRISKAVNRTKDPSNFLSGGRRTRLSDTTETRINALDALGPRLEPEGEDQATQERCSENRNIFYEQTDGLLFSDYGSENDDDEYIERRRGLKATDYDTAMDEALSAVYLNSGTLIKMAIIGVELQNVVKVSLRKAEAEVASLQKRIRQLEDELESTETRLQEATLKLEEASKAADESDRGRKVLENRTFADEERINQLEEQLKESTFMAEDADRKYDEAARKLAITEVELERAESRLEAAESKITELEEELRIVGNNVKSLEISEQEAAQREEAYEENIRDLTERLKAAEDRAQESERLVNTLQADADRLEDELVTEKEKYKALSEELDSTFAELTGN
uniref:Tropomyosin-2 n=1 Tax=Schistosoma japonicum TaxID=6182 RepID=C1LNS1_SCHJA|nr:Tropomyosin-2 [Schistosoma japonicum]